MKAIGMARMISTSLMLARLVMMRTMTMRLVPIQAIIKMPLRAVITIMGSGTTSSNSSSSSNRNLKTARPPARIAQLRAHLAAEVTRRQV